jgi:hypothetical protein
MEETPLAFELKVSLIHLYPPKTEDGMNVIQLRFEFEVSFIHIFTPKTEDGMNAKW